MVKFIARPFSGLRLRLLILIMIAVTPTAGLGLYASLSERRDAAARAQRETLDFVRLIAAREEEQITEIRQVLVLIAERTPVRDGGPAWDSACSTFVANLNSHFPYYANVGAAALNGDLYCSAVLPRGWANAAHRKWFNDAVRTRTFSAGDYQVGRVTGKSEENFGYPIFDTSGAVRGVAFVALDVDRFAQVGTDMPLPSGADLLIVDRTGAILTRYPYPDQWIGRMVPDTPIFRTLRRGGGEGSIEGVGEDGVRRVYAFAQLGSGPAYVALGVPTNLAFAEADRTLAGTLAALACAALLAFAAATVAADRFVFRGINTLLAATARVSAGDLTARVGSRHGKGELGALAHAFDEMTASLRARAAETATAEEALRHSERRFRALIEHSSDLTMLTQADGTVTYVSPSIERILGYSPDELVGRSAFALAHPDDAARIHEAFATSLQAPGAHAAVEFRARHKTGAWRWIDAVEMNLLANPDVQAIVGHYWDITKRKEAEEAARRRAVDLEALHDIAQTLRQARSPQAIYDTLVDRAMALFGAIHGSLALLNPDRTAFTRVATKGIAAEAVGSTFPVADSHSGQVVENKVSFVTGDFASVVRPHAWMAPEPYQILGPFALVPVRSEEDVLGTLVVARPRDPDSLPFMESDVRLLETIAETAGNAIRRARLYADLQRHAAELEQRVSERTAALSEAKDEADRANRAKSEFLSRMSHELRTPLNSVLGFAQLLEMDSLRPEQAKNVGYIVKGGRHLLTLINEVLDIARIEAGRLKISVEPVALHNVVRETLDLTRPLAADRQVRVACQTEVDAARHVLADNQRLKQILLNLLSNAIKYGGPNGTVTLSCEDVPGGRVRIKVTDSGPGIPTHKMWRLFIPFERLGSEHAGVEGTGLGLALSKGLAEAMGGTLGVESTVGVGSTFWVELPAAEGPLVRLEAERQDAADTASIDSATRTAGILYIEDNLSNFELIKEVLSQRPQIKLLAAMQGRLGFEIARRHRPDLILLDLHLPDIQGDEVLRQLQQAPETRAIPVVMISADATTGQADRLVKAGARAYITKPFNVKRLLALVDELLTAPEVRRGAG